MTPLVDDHHRLVLGPTAASAWDRRLAALPAGDITSIGALCGEADLDAALARVHDGLPVGGRFVFVEHIGRPGALGRLQRAWGATTAHLPWGCRVGRDIPAAVRRAGFHLTDLERFTMPTPVPVLRSWVSGVAVKGVA
ncbi:MAG: SAM-dependent methyltransferase [Actinomycetia bacterium]|nr:SAM-dependent methyltransferase [Actinomycetes bacterium]